MPWRPHELRLFLDSPLYQALVQFQASRRLGASYAGLLIFLEGLRALELIDEDTYEYYSSRYDKPLTQLIPGESEQIRQNQQKREADVRKLLRGVIEQYSTLKPRAQLYWVKYASEHPEFPESVELLRKAEHSGGE